MRTETTSRNIPCVEYFLIIGLLRASSVEPTNYIIGWKPPKLYSTVLRTTIAGWGECFVMLRQIALEYLCIFQSCSVLFSTVLRHRELIYKVYDGNLVMSSHRHQSVVGNQNWNISRTHVYDLVTYWISSLHVWIVTQAVSNKKWTLHIGIKLTSKWSGTDQLAQAIERIVLLGVQKLTVRERIIAPRQNQ